MRNEVPRGTLFWVFEKTPAWNAATFCFVRNEVSEQGDRKANDFSEYSFAELRSGSFCGTLFWVFVVLRTFVPRGPEVPSHADAAYHGIPCRRTSLLHHGIRCRRISEAAQKTQRPGTKFRNAALLFVRSPTAFQADVNLCLTTA
jgi:hypothetical protein